MPKNNLNLANLDKTNQNNARQNSPDQKMQILELIYYPLSAGTTCGTPSKQAQIELRENKTSLRSRFFKKFRTKFFPLVNMGAILS